MKKREREKELIEKAARLRALELGLVEWATQICLDMYGPAFKELAERDG